MDVDLTAEKQRLLLKLEILEKRKSEILEKEIVLFEKIAKYEKMNVEINNKRERANTIANEEDEQIKIKEDEIQALKIRAKEIQKEKEDLQQEQKDCKIHQFLEKVLEASNGELKQIKDVVLKYESLSNVLQNLEEKLKVTQDVILDEKKGICAYTKDQKQRILSLHENLRELGEKIENAEEEIYLIQEDLDLTRKMETERRLKYEQAKLSISNMVVTILTHCGKHIKTDDPIQQIEKVQQYMDDLKMMVVATKDGSIASDAAQATSSVGR